MTETVVESYDDAVFMRDRVIRLHGITVVLCACGPAPVYPKLGRLAPLVKDNIEVADFYYDGFEWSLTRNHDAHLGAARE